MDGIDTMATVVIWNMYFVLFSCPYKIKKITKSNVQFSNTKPWDWPENMNINSVTQQNLMYFLIYDNFALHPNYMVQYLKKCVGFFI